MFFCLRSESGDWLTYLVYQLEACFLWREKPLELMCPDSDLRQTDLTL